MIPKLVIQTLSSRNLPANLAAVRQGMIDRNPGYQFRLFDEEDRVRFIQEHYDERTLAAYNRISPDYGAARADLFRYLALYELGGIYLDIKSFFSAPIDTVLAGDDEFVLSQWRNKPGEVHAGFGLHRDLTEITGGEFQQWHIISAPRHPFLKSVIERVVSNVEQYSPWRFGVSRIGVQRTTGPIAYTLAILPLLRTAPHRRIANETELSLHYSAENYSHMEVFKNHYSLQTKSVVTLPFYKRPTEAAFRMALGAKRWAQGLRA